MTSSGAWLVFLNEEQISLQKKAYSFAKKHLRSNEAKWEAEGTFPKETFAMAKSEGYVGMLIPKELGGQGLGFSDWRWFTNRWREVHSHSHFG